MTITKKYKVQDIYPTFQTEPDAVEDDISEEVTKLKFFCGKINAKKNCCFSHRIGLPQHPATLNQMKFMPHQDDLVKQALVDNQVKFHVNKSRQIGLTEICLRIIQYQCFHKYKGGRVMIIAGTREKTTKKVMGRLKQMFGNIHNVIESDHNDLLIRLANGTEIEGLPSNSEAIRGDTKIKAILIDEAAHFGLVDDSVVLDAVEPIVMTNKSDLFLVSTPRSQRGFFYEIHKGENDFKKLQYDFTNAIGWIYSKEEMDKELTRTDIDVDQEYRCQFTSGRNSIFGVISDESTEDFEVEEY
tara:strand:- start:3414 stop:4313 length:900 start_codon:yes stop_codon:yes gene_type:complete